MEDLLGRGGHPVVEIVDGRPASLYLEARIELQRELDATPHEETSWGACLVVMIGGTFVLVCFLLGVVTLVQFLWKLVS